MENRTSRLVDETTYLKFVEIPIQIAVQRGLGTSLATISAEGICEPPDPFFQHDLPLQFAWWGHMFFGQGSNVATRRLPAVTINAFQQASLIGHDGVVVLTDGTELDFHLNFTQPFRPGSLIHQIEGALWRPDLTGTFHAGRFILGHTPAWSNYAHWLTDSLPIWVFYATHLRHQGIRLIVPPLSTVQAEALDLLGIEETDVLRTEGDIKSFELLLVPSIISVWEPPTLFRDAALQILSKVTSNGTQPKASRARLYFSRRDVTTRQLLNENAVESLLISYGFEVVCCSELTFADQVARSASAEIIVGCHGAAMANTIFCSPGCSVIELFPEYCVQPGFRAIAARCHCPYGYVIGTSFDRENSRRDQNSWDADFVIDLGALERALTSALG